MQGSRLHTIIAISLFYILVTASPVMLILDEYEQFDCYSFFKVFGITQRDVLSFSLCELFHGAFSIKTI
jgi:hypothetical protein